MKTSTTILALFALLFLFCSAQTYTPLTPAQIASNIQVQALIQTGLAQVISMGAAKDHFSNNDFSVTKVNSVSQAAVTRGNSYKIDVNYTNTADEAARAKFTGLFNTKTSKISISTISYTVQYPSTTTPIDPTDPTTTPIDVDQLETDAVLKGLFDYGFDRILQIGVNAGKVPDTDYTVTKVNSITKKETSSSTSYAFSCVANNDDGNITVTMSFTVTSKKFLSAYSYKVSQQNL